MPRLIDANAIPYEEHYVPDGDTQWEYKKELCVLKPTIDAMPTVDAVEVDAIRAWLYEIAMNNADNTLSDACEEIISRLDGLRAFAREMESA